MKRWIAVAVTWAMLLSLFSGVVWSVAAEELPPPYFWIDTMGGTFSTNGEVEHSDGISLTPDRIDEQNGFGIKLTGDWQGFWADGNFFSSLPSGETACLLVEYYVTEPGISHQLFRVMPADNVMADGTEADGEQWIDYFTRGHDGQGFGNDKIVVGQRGVLVYSYTPQQMQMLKDRPFTIGILGCPGGVDNVYIKSVKLVNGDYVATADRGFALDDLTPQPISEYYPDTEETPRLNMVRQILENTADFAGYVYYKIYGAPMAPSRTENKLLYVRLYAAAGYENDTIYVDEYEVSADGDPSTWSSHVGKPIASVSMTNGVGGTFLMASFNNTLNGSGSIRFHMNQAEKIIRIEVYDASNYCVMPNADEVLRTQFHAYKVSASVGVDVQTTVTKKTVVCQACGETVSQTEVNLPTPYAWMDVTSSGVVSDRTVAAQGEYGSITPRAIPDTNNYGLRLDYDWSGFYMSGDMLKNVPAGQSVTMVIEYYTTKTLDANYQLFRYVVADGYAQTDLYVDERHLVGEQRGFVLHTFTAEELADLQNKDFRFFVLGCVSGAEQVYVTSMRLVNTEYVHPLNYGNGGDAFVDFAGQVVCDYYPDAKEIYGHNTRWNVYEQHGGFEGYMYVRVFGNAYGDEQNRNKPIMLKVYAAEGCESSQVLIEAVDISDADGHYQWGKIPTTYFKDGVATVMFNACFKNRLNGGGSLRVMMRDISTIARIEIYDVETYCAQPLSDEKRAELHAPMLASGMNLTITGRVDATDSEDGYTGDVYCATCEQRIANGKKIPALLQNGLPAPYVWFDISDGELYGNYNVYASGADTAAVKIDDANGYGILLPGDWQGVYLHDDFLGKVPAGQSVTLVVEYYVAAGWSSPQILRISPAGNVRPDGTWAEGEQWMDCFLEGSEYNGLNVVKTQKTALVTYTYTAEQIEALRGQTFSIGVRGCPGGANVTYVKSLRVVKTDHVWIEGEMDYVQFEETAHSGYYPHVILQKNSGITAVPVVDGVALGGELNRYMYAQLTYSLLQEGEAHCPVAVRFTFREDSNVTAFDWQYQTARAENGAFTANYTTLHSTVKNGVVEVVLDDAAFTNGIHSAGSLRVPNTDSCPVWDSLSEVQIIRVQDRTALTARIEAADEVLGGTVPSSRAAYEAALAHARAVEEDLFATKRAIVYAAAQLDTAAQSLVACDHAVGTELVGYRAETCLEAGYTGNTACRTCGFVVTYGEEIPAHEVVLQNAAEATCAAAGYTGDRYCTQCQLVVQRGTSTEQLPHPWNDGEVVKEATAAEAGERVFTCTACGETRREEFRLDMVAGDVNGDDKIDSTDARVVLQYAVGKVTAAALNTAAADVNGDGKADSTDARMILQYAVGKIAALG